MPADFKLIKEDGLKYAEVAQLLDLSVKTVENQMSIAIKKLAAAVNHMLEAHKRNAS
ncbi:sigma-70 region 4 domain-containing protein [Niabella defluvii]|nr:sigma-70 region 4 domain-containing protein [Niabella sp. I65]